jgi:hypothetical protein
LGRRRLRKRRGVEEIEVRKEEKGNQGDRG